MHLDKIGKAWFRSIFSLMTRSPSLSSGGNFDGIGVLYISLDLKTTLQGVDEQPVVFKVNDEVMTLADDFVCGLWNDTGFSGYNCGTFLANGEIRKQ